MTINNRAFHEKIDLLQSLFAAQFAIQEDPYLRSHSHAKSIRDHTLAFKWYSTYLKPKMSILDWGTNHGPDSCLLRSLFGEEIDLHACDFPAETGFQAFREYSKPIYKQLMHQYQLPYKDWQFDAVVASGVLEHTALDYESLKEVQRILKPDGTLIITYLPFGYSLREWWLRRIKKVGFHNRTYYKDELSRLLKRAGFVPHEIGFHSSLRLPGDSPVFERIAHRCTSAFRPFFMNPVLRCAARKVGAM